MNLSRFKALVLSCVATVAFVGCGGGSDSTAPAPVVATGTFVDAPVQGLKYTTATQNGYTDSNGTYKFVAGEQIEFFLGTLSLGKVTASTLVTPYTMAGDTNISAPSDKAKNIAMLLQNFDANRSDSAVLDVSKLKDHDFSDVNLSVTTADMETKITALLGTLATLIDSNHPLINTATASNAMKTYVADATLKSNAKFTTEYLSGKTFYVVSNWGSDGWVTLTNTFHNDGTYSYYDAPDANATVDYAVTTDGRLKIMSRDPSDPIFYATIKAVTDEYIEVNEYTESTATYKSTNTYLYFDKAKAGAKQLQLQNQELATTKKFTAEYLSGKTFYPVEFWNSWVTMKDVFNSNGTWSHYDSPDGNFTELYEVTTDGRIKVTTSEVINPVFYLTIKAVTDEYIEVTSSVSANYGYFYFDKAKADAKLALLQSATVSVGSGFGAEWLAGKTLWTVFIDGTNSVTATFTFNNGKNTAQLGLLDTITSPLFNNDYTITADGIIDVTESGSSTGHQYYRIIAIDGTKISLCDGEVLADVKACTTPTQWFFTTKASAQAY